MAKWVRIYKCRFCGKEIINRSESVFEATKEIGKFDNFIMSFSDTSARGISVIKHRCSGTRYGIADYVGVQTVERYVGND